MIQVSIDDYLDGLLSGSSEPSRKAIMKLTRLIENFGSIMVKSTERMEDYINTLDTRISTIEQSLGIVSQRLIVGKGASAAAPIAATPIAAAPAAAPALDTPAAAPALDTPAGAPNLSAAPSGAPNLSAAPSGNVGAPTLDGGGANIPAPTMPSGSGSGVSNSDLMNAAANLQKAPEQPAPGEPGAPGAAPVFSPFGVSATDIQDVKSGLTKVDPDEHRKERAAATTEGGSMPASMALNTEVKEVLQKRKSKSEDDDEDDFVPAQAAPTAPQKSTKQMKEALQGELRDAFSSLLESDTQDEEE